MNILFIANHTNTIFYYSLTQKLEEENHTVFWISPSNYWSLWLQERGILKQNILDITLYSNKCESNNDFSYIIKELLSLETELSVRNVIMMDRVLSNKPFNYALNYLAVCNHYINSFLSEKKINVLFSEIAWAIEIITILLCKKNGIYSYAPSTTRIPSGRFVFFNGYKQESIAITNHPTTENIEEAKQFLNYFYEKKPKPDYFYLNNSLPRFQLNWVKKFFNHLYLKKPDYQYDETIYTTKEITHIKLSQIINKYSFLLNKKLFEYPAEKKHKPFILYTLHKQPETSVDVLGAYYSCQLETIKAIARSLPITHDFYVKEHSNSIGDRSFFYYKKIKKIPCVKLISPYIDSFSLINEADLVISISGTACYEAALLGKRAIVITPMFFGPLMQKNGLDIYETSVNSLSEIILSDYVVTEEQKIEFLSYVIANSFPGVIGDPINDPSCMQEKNLQNVANGFLLLLDSIKM